MSERYTSCEEFLQGLLNAFHKRYPRWHVGITQTQIDGINPSLLLLPHTKYSASYKELVILSLQAGEKTTSGKYRICIEYQLKSCTYSKPKKTQHNKKSKAPRSKPVEAPKVTTTRTPRCSYEFMSDKDCLQLVQEFMNCAQESSTPPTHALLASAAV